MEHILRVERVQNGFIFTDENSDRYVDSEPNLAIKQVVDRVVSATEKFGDVTILVITPDKPEEVGTKKGY